MLFTRLKSGCTPGMAIKLHTTFQVSFYFASFICKKKSIFILCSIDNKGNLYKNSSIFCYDLFSTSIYITYKNEGSLLDLHILTDIS